MVLCVHIFFVTFGGPCHSQVVNGPQHQPEGLLLLNRDAQNLHGRLQLRELLGGPLLLLRLHTNKQTNKGALVEENWNEWTTF